MKLRLHSLKKRADFLSLSEGGSKISTACCVILFRKNELEFSRLGLTVSRKISKSAVKRNKVRRRFRAIFKELLPEIKDHLDIVFIARSKVVDSEFQQLKAGITLGLKKGGLLI